MAMTRRSRRYSSLAAASLASPERMGCACTRSVTKEKVMPEDRRKNRKEQLGRPKNNGVKKNTNVASLKVLGTDDPGGNGKMRVRNGVDRERKSTSGNSTHKSPHGL